MFGSICSPLIPLKCPTLNKSVSKPESILDQAVETLSSCYDLTSKEVGKLSDLAVTNLTAAKDAVSEAVAEYEPAASIVAAGAGTALAAKAGYDIYKGGKSLNKIAAVAVGTGLAATVIGLKAVQFFTANN